MIREPESRSGSEASGSAVPRENRTVNQKVLPSPGSLRTPISPPIKSVSCLQIASPSPVPP